ncbi:MAG: hypothetical protein Q605_AUC00312G0001, partial [Actinomyces urogenitalis DORA_12]
GLSVSGAGAGTAGVAAERSVEVWLVAGGTAAGMGAAAVCGLGADGLGVTAVWAAAGTAGRDSVSPPVLAPVEAGCAPETEVRRTLVCLL